MYVTVRAQQSLCSRNIAAVSLSLKAHKALCEEVGVMMCDLGLLALQKEVLRNHHDCALCPQ